MRTDIQQVLNSLIADMIAERQSPHRDREFCEALSDAIASLRRVRDRREAMISGNGLVWEERTEFQYPLSWGLFRRAHELMHRRESSAS